MRHKSVTPRPLDAVAETLAGALHDAEIPSLAIVPAGRLGQAVRARMRTFEAARAALMGGEAAR